MDQSVGTPWESELSSLRLFRYITFRTAGAAVTALLLSLWFGPKVIAWLKELSFGQNYRDRAEEAGNLTGREPKKFGTPTMGGLLIVLTLNLTTLLWAQWNTLVQLTVLSVVVLAMLGFYDDYTKITKASSGGAKSRVKLWVQTGLAVFIGIYLWYGTATQALITDIMVPFYKHPVMTGAGGVGLVLTVLTIVGSSNAVNLTDGLDGLAIGCTLIVSFVFLIMTYVAGNVKTAAYLQIPHVSGAGELTVFCAALCGAGLGFLWFNCHPAQVFMGDTGSLERWAARARNCRGADPSTAGAGDRGRGVRDGSGVGDFANRLFPVHAEALRHWQTDFFDGADSPSFREEALA